MVTCVNSKNFLKFLQDAGGFEINDQRWELSQKRTKLPTYIPQIANGSGRLENLRAHTVSLTTFDVVKIGRNERPSTPETLREKYKIQPDARIILTSVEKDNKLEWYWRHEVSNGLPQQLFELGIQYVTSPNFSFPLNVPRPEHLVNRRRTLRSAERLSAAGLDVIPHLNAVTETDWDCWRDFLRDHPHLHYVALEFQTGLRTVRKAKWHLGQLLNLQESLGREVHLIAIGGKQHIRFLSEFSGVTIIDSSPFIWTHKRRKVQRVNNRWTIEQSAPDEPLHDLLQHNFDLHKRSVMALLYECRKRKLGLLSEPSRLNLGEHEPKIIPMIVDPQLKLPFGRHPRNGDLIQINSSPTCIP